MFTSSHLAPTPLTSRYTQVPQQFSYNDASTRLRIMNLVRPLMPNAHPDNLNLLVTHICSTLTRMRRAGQLGPKGIQSTEDVFIGVGYDKAECYMGLIVNAPGALAVRCFFEGDRMETSKKTEMKPEAAIEELRIRLAMTLHRKYKELRDVKHKLSHRGLDYECLKCYRSFKTYGGMIIHLESGCCSGVDRDSLNALAAQCNRSREFILSEYEENLLDGDLEYYHGKVNPFFCPTCDTEVPRLSSLFQHVESRACSQTLEDGVMGTLRRFLANYV
ncbi:hypothetical protein E8E12_007432 [Didymella heteroderae]|uniref:C2H2-type domain-containing protein n=1 Tax=Didymella heteroderae TaxID=1769908 RepID=A0A9P4WVF4_9PLEO|nr:hypothetical protein E8E12_007432 [Didymella heteroderae]